MNKKILFSLCLVLLFIFSFTYTFAANGLESAADGVRNVVGGAENMIEGAAKGVSNTTKDMTGGIENGARNVTGDTRNTTGALSTHRNDNYTATRTATTGGTLMGMNGTAWTWVILAIAAVSIIALVWYYSMQLTGNNYSNRND